MQRELKLAGICLAVILIAALSFTSKGSKPAQKNQLDVTLTPEGKPAFHPRGKDAAVFVVVGSSNLAVSTSSPTNAPGSE